MQMEALSQDKYNLAFVPQTIIKKAELKSITLLLEAKISQGKKVTLIIVESH